MGKINKLQKTAEGLLIDLEAQMEQVLLLDDSGEKYQKGLAICESVIAKLKAAQRKYGFQDTLSEICFFKHLKPKIYAWLIFVSELHFIEVQMPRYGKKKKLTYVKNQLSFINRFFRQHEFGYQYYKIGAFQLDEFYFLRGVDVLHIGLSLNADLDNQASTVGDFLFSKFIAYEMLQTHLLSEIKLLKSFNKVRDKSLKEIKWTGEQVNLVELIYGLYETGQINEGKVSLSELLVFFGQVFQLNLYRSFKRFADIKNRKIISKTRFLDDMQRKLAKRIENDDAWDPQS